MADPVWGQRIERELSRIHHKFWDLEVVYIEVKGKKYFKPTSNASGDKKYELHVTVGQTVAFKCHYNIKTINRSSITERDAMYWGTGKHKYMTNVGIYLTLSALKATYSLPAFDYDNVKSVRAIHPYLQWHRKTVYNWVPKTADVGKYIALYYKVDWKNSINEFDETNNDILFDKPVLFIRIIVHPLIKKSIKIKKK
jgi:hypothetical protein